MKDILLTEIIDKSAVLSATSEAMWIALGILVASWVFFALSFVFERRHMRVSSEVCADVWFILLVFSVMTLLTFGIEYVLTDLKLGDLVRSYEAVYGPLPGGII